MNVAELITILQEQPSDADVLISYFDSDYEVINDREIKVKVVTVYEEDGEVTEIVIGKGF